MAISTKRDAYAYGYFNTTTGPLPGEGPRNPKDHPTEGAKPWIQFYEHELHGLGGHQAQANTQDGHVHGKPTPLCLRLLKEGFGVATGALIKTMFDNQMITDAQIDIVEHPPEGGEETIRYTIKLRDAGIADWEFFQEGGTPDKPDVETLEWITIVASDWELMDQGVDQDSGGHDKTGGHGNYGNGSFGKKYHYEPPK